MGSATSRPGLLRTLAVNGWCREYSAAAQRSAGWPLLLLLSACDARARAPLILLLYAFAFRRCDSTALGSLSLRVVPCVVVLDWCQRQQLARPLIL
jgi:hypothetical protein